MGIEVELKAPAILIAVPQLGDPNFQRAVVLMVEHSDEGSMGLVINRPTDLQIGSCCDSQGMPFKGDGEQPDAIEGFVLGRLLLVHWSRRLAFADFDYRLYSPRSARDPKAIAVLSAYDTLPHQPANGGIVLRCASKP